MKMNSCAALAAAVSLLFFCGGAQAAKPKPLFAGEEMLHLTLRGAISSIPRGIGEKPIPATLTVEGAALETLPVNLTVRGITRRKKTICAFPPLRLNFDKTPETSLFSGQKHLKLVTYCQNSDSFDQQRLLEYSAYKLYNLITPISLKVRLAKITYVTDEGRQLAVRYGFLIEEMKDVAKRNGLDELSGVKAVTVPQLDAAAAARFAVFEYMISNMDWSMIANAPGLDCCHNSRLLGADGVTGASSGLIPVPLDFDESGVVDAPYATTPAGYPVTSVKLRRYGGFCIHNAQAQSLLAQLQPRRAEFTALFDKIPDMDDRTRRTGANYIDTFFTRTATPDQVADLQKTCLR